MTIQFPDLQADPDDRIWVTMRNPKLVPIDDLRAGRESITLNAAGEPEDMGAATSAGYAILVRLIVGWHVYDATTMPELNAAGEDVSTPALLPQAPVTMDTVAKLPMVILNRLMEELSAVNPQATPASQEATGTPS